MRSKPVNNTPPGPLHQLLLLGSYLKFLPWLPWMMDCELSDEIKPFSHVALGHGVYHSNRNANKDIDPDPLKSETKGNAY